MKLSLPNTAISPTLGALIDSTESQREQWVQALIDHVSGEGFAVEEEQIVSWRDCLQFMAKHLPRDVDRSIHALFEYKLPFTAGMRTDVILLLDTKVLVLEFKRTKGIKTRYGTQVINYCGHLYRHHDLTANAAYAVEGAIVWTLGTADSPEEVLGIPVATSKSFAPILQNMIKDRRAMARSKEWCESAFVMLPSMLEAASGLLFEGELPMIKTIQESDIAECNKKVAALITKAEAEHKKIAIVVSGVPGAGKTLVALDTVFKYNRECFKAIYVTGNNPLVYALRAEFTEAANKYKDQEKAEQAKAANKFINRVVEYKAYKDTDAYIIAFDEGQRLWDENRMGSGQDELEYLITRLDAVYKVEQNAVLLCMYGDGQVIGRGEEAGLKLWEKAIKAHPDWEFYFPNNLADELEKDFGVRLEAEAALRLDVSIRNDFINVDSWIASLLKSEVKKEDVQKELDSLMRKGFSVYITRDFETIQKAMPGCKTNASMMQYGLIGSSNAAGYKDANFKRYTNGRVTKSYFEGEDTGEWYLHRAEQLDWVATEYACQGLEIAWPIVMFGNDLYMKAGQWKVNKGTNAFRRTENGHRKFDKPAQIIGNIYRVLLTRSRTGMILFLPKEEAVLDELYRFFVCLGIEELTADMFVEE